MPEIVYTTGVYCLRNMRNNKVYVGSTARGFVGRMRGHWDALKYGYHCNKHLLAAYRKYGVKAFRFSILEKCHPSKCIEREQYWIDELRAADRRYGYNKLPTAGSSLGYQHEDDAKARMSEAHKKRLEDPAERQRQSELMKAAHEADPTIAERSRELQKELWQDPEYRANQVAKRKGKKHSEETKRTMNADKKGVPRSPEVKAKISAGLTGKKMSEETKAKCSEAQRLRYQDPEERRKTAEKSRGVKKSPETLEKMSALMTERYQDPEERRKQSERAKQDWARRKAAKTL